jgi:hypothetical protein
MVSTSSLNFYGGVLCPNGNVLLVGSTIGMYNSSKMTIYPTNAYQSGLKVPFKGGCLTPTGQIFMAPWGGSNVGVFNLNDYTYSNSFSVGSTNSFTGANLLRDGRVIFGPAGFVGSTLKSPYGAVLSTFTPSTLEFCTSPYFNKF